MFSRALLCGLLAASSAVLVVAEDPHGLPRRQVIDPNQLVPTPTQQGGGIVTQPTGSTPGGTGQPVQTGAQTVGPTDGLPFPEDWASNIRVTLDMHILTATDADQCLTSSKKNDVFMDVCNGRTGQLWVPNDARKLTWKNVLTDEVVDMRAWAAMEPQQYANLIFGQGFWTVTERSECSASCGWATFTVKQKCVNANGVPPAGWLNSYCGPDDRGPSVLPCTLPACTATDPTWSDWSDCSVTCGQGIQQRLCIEGFDTNVTCATLASSAPVGQGDTKLCDDSAFNWQPDCPVDGGYSAWSSCSVTCGYGVQQRTCNNPPPSNDGRNCSEQENGLGPSVASCNAGPCPSLDGNYTEWSDCSVTCGVGMQHRDCTNPPPSGAGRDCSLLGPNLRTCNQPVCNVTVTRTNTVFSITTSTLGTLGTLLPPTATTDASAAAPTTSAAPMATPTFNLPPTVFSDASSQAMPTAPPPVADEQAIPPTPTNRAVRRGDWYHKWL